MFQERTARLTRAAGGVGRTSAGVSSTRDDNERRDVMGDKGGRKDKDKSRKQEARKQKVKEKDKEARQPKKKI